MSFVKQKTAYERRISDWSSDVCSSDLTQASAQQQAARPTTQSLTPSRLAPGEEKAVREASRPCWNVDPAAIDVPAVKVRITMNADGTVQSAELTENGSGPAFRSAAEKALRAARNPSCQPWPLPAKKWPQWRVIAFNFDPEDLF